MKKLFKASVLALAVLSSTASAEGHYAVVVNKDNPFRGSQSALKNEIKLLFLKQKFRWENQLLSIPMSVPEESPAFKEFQTQVLNMNNSELSDHWLRMKLRNGESAPREVRYERVTARLVERNKGAFGIVSKEYAEKSQEDIHILFTF